MAENALAAMGDLGIVPYDDKAINSVSGGEFLPRIMVMQGSSEPVKDGKIQQGHLALVVDKSNPQDLGEVFDALLFHVRPKAMRLEGSEIVEDIYDVNDPAFNQIRVDSESKEEGVTAMYGPEFLVFLLKEQKFATFFYGNPTLRRETGTTKGLLGKQVTFQKKKITSKGRSWFGVTTFECKTPYEKGPGLDEAKIQITKFQTPTPRKKEAVKPATDAAAPARDR